MNIFPHIPGGRTARRRTVGGRGFTIAEIIVAVVITAFVGAAVSTALSQAARARDASAAKVEARLRSDAAAARIAADVETAVRHHEVFFTRFKLTERTLGAYHRDEVLMYSRSLRLARTRSEQGEGGEYEVQYRVDAVPGVPSLTAAGSDGVAALALWRRVDPVPDDVPDGGGVAAAIVEGVISLRIQAYDGSAWFSTWESDDSGYPHAVSIEVTATDDAGKYQAVTRRVVALDRTPLPLSPVVEEDTSETATQ